MKKMLLLLTVSLLSIGLAPNAKADAISLPVESTEGLSLRALPLILVIALVICTVILLLRLRKRK